MVKYLIGCIVFLALSQSSLAISCYSCINTSLGKAQSAQTEFLQAILKTPTIKSSRSVSDPTPYTCSSNIANSHSEFCDSSFGYDSCVSIFFDDDSAQHLFMRMCYVKSVNVCDNVQSILNNAPGAPHVHPSKIHCEECTEDLCNTRDYKEPALECYSCVDGPLNSQFLPNQPFLEDPTQNKCAASVNESHVTTCGSGYDSCLTLVIDADQNSTLRTCAKSEENYCDKVQEELQQKGHNYSSNEIGCQECRGSKCNNKDFTEVPRLNIDPFQCYTCISSTSLSKAFNGNPQIDFFSLYDDPSKFTCPSNANESHVADCDKGFEACLTVILDNGGYADSIRQCVPSDTTCEEMKSQMEGNHYDVSGFKCEVCNESSCNSKSVEDIRGVAGNIQVSFVVIALTAVVNLFFVSAVL